jgi:hypothetical protein
MEDAAAQQAPIEAEGESVGRNLCSVSFPGPGVPGEPRMQTGTGGEQEADDVVARASKTVRKTMNILMFLAFLPGSDPVNCNLTRTSVQLPA